MHRPTFPSLALVLESSRRDSFTLPDYYRTTRLETYGPYFRSSEPVPDLMKMIDHRGRGSIEFESSFLLPDIFEECETESDDINLQRQSESRDIESRGRPKTQVQSEQKATWFGRLLSTLRKYRGRKGPVKNIGKGFQLDSSK